MMGSYCIFCRRRLTRRTHRCAKCACGNSKTLRADRCVRCVDESVELKARRCRVCGVRCDRKEWETCSHKCRGMLKSLRHRLPAAITRLERTYSRAMLALARRAQRADLNIRRCKDCDTQIGRRVVRCAQCAAVHFRAEKRRFRQFYGRKYKQRAKRGAIIERGVSRLAVFRRDGWRCRLCGVVTPRHLSGTNNQHSPELDHIVPLALGGDHSWQNVQCLCRSCNAAKGCKVLGQLRINI